MIYDIDMIEWFLEDEEEVWEPEPLYLEDMEPEYYPAPVKSQPTRKRVIIIDI